MTHRNDIDFLRAIAVLAVIFFHMEIPHFDGGYVGVDVFFVISGFLITKLLVNEFRATCSINFTTFYIRRSKRLLPALLITIFVTSVLATLILSPERLKNYGASAFHAVLSISNFYFYFTSDYFDSASFTKPLLHTWSLGVEEQFYLFWPALVYVLSRFKIKFTAIYFILAILSISLILSEYYTKANTAASFFLTPLRIFEFTIGALLVYAPTTKISKHNLNNVFYLIGILLIILSVAIYDSKTLFPGLNALIPCAGACLCLYSGENVGYLKSPSIRYINYIGIISYSLYLVHWPIIVLYKEYYKISFFEISDYLIIISTIFSLSILQFHFIENKFRFKYSNKFTLSFLTSIFILIIYTSASMWALNGWSWRTWVSSNKITSIINPAQLLDAFNIGKEKRFILRKDICEKKGWSKCDEPTEGAINVLIIGDSHAVDALNSLASIYPNFDYSMSTLGGCPPYRNIESITTASHPNRSECKKLNELSRFNVNYLSKFNLIVINNLMSWYTSANLIEYINFLHQSGIKKVIVFGNYYSLTDNMYELINRFGFDDNKIKDKFKIIPDFTNEQIQTIRKNGYLFLSKKDLFCKDEKCEIFNAEKVPFTYDEHHLSYEFSSKMLNPVKETIHQYLNGEAPLQTNLTVGPESEKHAHSKSIQVLDWGPRSSIVGSIPNRQPNGSMGIWIKISGTTELKNSTLYFEGKPASGTYIQNNLVTASISPNELNMPGKKEVLIKTSNSNITIPVGTFVIEKGK